jgi:hypothetical protein
VPQKKNRRKAVFFLAQSKNRSYNAASLFDTTARSQQRCPSHRTAGSKPEASRHLLTRTKCRKGVDEEKRNWL